MSFFINGFFVFFGTFLEEVRRLEGEINRHKKEYEVLLEENCQALEELQQLKKLNSEQKTHNLDQSQKIKEYQRQLEAKEELVCYCQFVTERHNSNKSHILKSLHQISSIHNFDSRFYLERTSFFGFLTCFVCPLLFLVSQQDL